MTAMSGSLFGTNAHYKVKIGHVSLSHKIIMRVRAHYRFTCCTEARAAEGCYAPESFEGEGACSTRTRQPASLCIHFQLLTAGCNQKCVLVHLYCLFMQESIPQQYSEGQNNNERRNILRCPSHGFVF